MKCKVKKEKIESKMLIENKEKKSSKFINTIKKKWLIDGSKTLILVLIIIAAFFLPDPHWR